MSRNVPIAKPSDEGGLLETIKVVIQALAIALVIRTLLFQPFNIPSGSMIPTLLIGEAVFVGLREAIRLMREAMDEGRAGALAS